jgi:predicted RNase H-like HicB family nuclease
MSFSPRASASRLPLADHPLRPIVIQSPVIQQQFTAIIEHDPKSGWLVGSVAELAGCYTQAPDMASLKANMCEAINVYLDTVRTSTQPVR